MLVDGDVERAVMKQSSIQIEDFYRNKLEENRVEITRAQRKISEMAAETGMTVAEIAVAVDKTERGLRTLLTRRGIDVADYKGQAKKAKAEAKAAAAA